MYQNESVDDYIRSILGYPTTNPMYIDNTQMDYSMMNQQASRNEDLESCYPEIYRIIYPMVTQRCSRISEPVTRELIDSMTDEIYSAVEVTNEVQLNINLQNTTTTTTTRPENRTTTSKDLNRKEPAREDRSEDRQLRRNSTLQDLIRILLIRELLNRPGRHRPRPPFPGGPGRPPFPGGPGGGRPPFPGGPGGGGRPPMMPRDYDIYEQ